MVGVLSCQVDVFTIRANGENVILYRSFLFYHHLTDKTYVIFLQIKDHIKRDCHQSSSSASRGQDAEICSDQQLAPGAQGARGLTGRRAGTNQVSSGRGDIFNRTIHTPEPGCVCPILLVNGFRKVDNFLTTVCKNIKASGDEVQIVCRNLLLFHFDGAGWPLVLQKVPSEGS